MRRLPSRRAALIALALVVLIVGLTAPLGAAVWRTGSRWISIRGDGQTREHSGSHAVWTVTGLGPRGAALPGAAEAINDHGVIVGWRGDWKTGARAFMWRRGRLTDLGSLPERRKSVAEDINERGQVVGTSWGDDYASSAHAFLWEAGRMTDLGTLGGKTSYAEAINERGQIVGTTYTEGGDMRAFLWENGHMRDLGTLGGPDSEAYDINERGQIVGSSLTSARTDDTWDSTRPFFWQRERMRNLEEASSEDAYIAYAVALNNHGAILVKYKWSEGDGTAVESVSGTSYSLGALDADDINDRGFVVGTRGGRPAFRAPARTTATNLPGLEGGGSTRGEASGVNSRHQIVGWSQTRNGDQSAVLWMLKR